MPKKHRKFADDGWAVWIDGEDTSTIHINDWLNPKGKSYVDIAIHIRGIKVSKLLNVYVPFPVEKEEIEDVSLRFDDTKILQAIFSAACRQICSVMPQASIKPKRSGAFDAIEKPRTANSTNSKMTNSAPIRPSSSQMIAKI